MMLLFYVVFVYLVVIEFANASMKSFSFVPSVTRFYRDKGVKSSPFSPASEDSLNILAAVLPGISLIRNLNFQFVKNLL